MSQVSVLVSHRMHKETNFCMLCVAIGCNSPFTTVNLLCANTTVCACVSVMISWRVFSLNTDQSSFCRKELWSLWPLLFSQLYLSSDVRLFTGLFFLALCLLYIWWSVMRGTHPWDAAWPFLLHLKSALMTGSFTNTQCQWKGFDILLQLSGFVCYLSNTGLGNLSPPQKRVLFVK